MRATTAGGVGGLLTAASRVRVQRSRRECAEMRGRSLTEKLMMLFTFLSSVEDENGTPTRGSSSFSRTEAHVLSGSAAAYVGIIEPR